MEEKNMTLPPNSRVANKGAYEAFFKKAQDSAFREVFDIAKLPTSQSQVFNRDTLRNYMENPTRYARELRNLSRFLKNRSQVYKKMITDNATMIDTHYRSIIPNIDPTKKNQSDSQILKSYYDTAKMLEEMHLPSEMLKVYLECWTVDVFYGAYYYVKGEGSFLLPLDPDYCQITGLYATGDFAFKFDCTYFRSKPEMLELWGEPFTSMYREYEKDTTNGRWQQMPAEYACCMKVNIEDYLYSIPPYLPVFDSIINIEDLKGIMSIADAQQIYKMIAFKMLPKNNGQGVDDFPVDPSTVADYYWQFVRNLPDYIGAFVTPVDVEAITFDQDQASDVNKVENSSKNILKTAGHIALADPSGTTAMMAAIKADEDFAISSLLVQTEAWVNRMLSVHLSKPSRVKFLEVTKYTKNEFKESLKNDLNYGLPMITTLGALNGYSELDLISMAKMNDALGLRDLFKPYETASTRSEADSEGGRPENSIPTDEGEASKEERDRNG